MIHKIDVVFGFAHHLDSYAFPQDSTSSSSTYRIWLGHYSFPHRLFHACRYCFLSSVVHYYNKIDYVSLKWWIFCTKRSNLNFVNLCRLFHVAATKLRDYFVELYEPFLGKVLKCK